MKISQVIIVEGKYDKIKLESIVEGLIVPLDGFSVFSDDQKLDAIRRMAAERGVLILTDPDAAGFKLRSFIAGALPKSQVFHAYIPDVKGKEKRKSMPSKEGKLGVEGIDTKTLTEILRPFECASPRPSLGLTKADLFADGLCGVPGSEERRRRFARAAGLPERIGANALLDFINACFGHEQYLRLLEQSALPDA